MVKPFSFGTEIPPQEQRYAVRGPMGLVHNQCPDKSGAIQMAVVRSHTTLTAITELMEDGRHVIRCVYEHGTERPGWRPPGDYTTW